MHTSSSIAHCILYAPLYPVGVGHNALSGFCEFAGLSSNNSPPIDTVLILVI